MGEIIIGFFICIVVLSILLVGVRDLRSYAIIREVAKILASRIQRRIVPNATKEQFDCIVVDSSYITFKPYSALGGFSYGELNYCRKNGGRVYLSGKKQLIKMAKYLISELNLIDYTYVCDTEIYMSSNEYTSTVTGTSSGVEVKTSPSISRDDIVIICRRDRVDEFAPKKKKTYHL